MSAFSVGQLAQELYTGYLAYVGTSVLLTHPQIDSVLAGIEATNPGPASVPIGSIARHDGSDIFYDFSHALRNIRLKPEYQETYDRLWLGGALLTLGDHLADEGYFDHGHDLEFVRHLRNGVAHGNRFRFSHGEPRRPAHFTGPDQRFLQGTTTPPGHAHTFEIATSLQGQPILFDFIGPGDVCDLLLFVSVRLLRIGNGDPPMPLFPQRP